MELSVKPFNFQTLLPLRLNESQKRYLKLKRWIELPLAILALLISLPLIVILSCWIRIDSPGNPFFLQKRPGKNGKLFRLIKLRSMRSSPPGQPLKLNTRNDHRVTLPGKWMRKFHLDELPQLLNVVLGHMSFVGPRPVPAALYELYKSQIPAYDYRHLVRPGITGFAQVWQGYTSTPDEEALKWKYDTYYIKRVSPAEDLKALIYTLKRPNPEAKDKMQHRVMNFHNEGDGYFESPIKTLVLTSKLN